MSECGGGEWRRGRHVLIAADSLVRAVETEDPDASDLPERPRTRADCAAVERPCPWTGCRFNLYLDVKPQTGTIALNFPHLEPDDMIESCALDVAERGAHTAQEISELLNVSHQRITQILDKALRVYRRISPDPEEPGVKNPPTRRISRRRLGRLRRAARR